MASKRIIAFFILVLLASFSMAQEKDESKYYINNDRNWLVEIPIWIPGFRGEFVFGEVRLSSSNEKDSKEKKRLANDLGLEFFFVGRAAVRVNNFYAHTDAFSSKLSSKVTYDRLVGNSEPELINLKLQLTVSRINAGYSIWKTTNERDFKIEAVPYCGLRFYNVGLEGAIIDSVYSGSTSNSWIDPIIGLYIPVSYKRFLFNAQWDISFDNSKSSWMLITQVQYRISKLVDVKIGWSHLNMNYTTAVNNTNLELYLQLAGPTAGIGFRF